MLLALFSSWLQLDPSSGSLEMPNILSWQLSALWDLDGNLQIWKQGWKEERIQCPWRWEENCHFLQVEGK